MDLYEIEFKYLDALDEPWHTANVVCYDPDTEIGEKLASALRNEEYDKANDIMAEPLGVTDDDVCFYYDWSNADANGHNAGVLVIELQASHDILISNYTYIEGV